jgi:hypothetical protein
MVLGGHEPNPGTRCTDTVPVGTCANTVAAAC